MWIWLAELLKPDNQIVTYHSQPEHLKTFMFSRNLSVLDFVRRFFVSCAQISEAYAVRTPLKFECDWRKIGHKSKCRKDSERTSKITSLFCISKLYSYSFAKNINQGLVHCFVNFISCCTHFLLKAIIVLVNTDLQGGLLCTI